MSFQGLDEEEPQPGTVLHHGTGMQLSLSKQMRLKLPQMLGSKPVGRLTEVRSQFAHDTNISPRRMLRIVSTLELLQHHFA